MGFMDKMKAGAKNLDNRLGQSVDSASYDSKIYDQKSAKEKAIKDAGEKMFAAYCEGKTEITSEIKDLYEKAKACDVEIEKLEKEKAEMIAKAEAERQANRDAANAADEKKEEESKEEEKKE